MDKLALCKFKNFGYNVEAGVYDLLFPHTKCLICNKNEIDSEAMSPICLECLEKLTKEYRICPHCGRFIGKDTVLCPLCLNAESPYITKVISALPYDKNIRNMILNLKYHDERANKVPLGKYMAYILKNNIVYSKIDIITYVPMFPAKEKKKGYNHGGELAKMVGMYLDLPVLNNIIIRKYDTASQTSKNREERFLNMVDCFGFGENIKYAKDKNILVVDDVYTTGATADAMGKVLLEGGANNVYWLTMATGSKK